MLSFSVFVFAEETLHLQDLEVQSDPLSTSSQHILKPVSVLLDEELDRGNKNTISDLVGQSPGISSTGFGPGVGRPVIRGQSGVRVGVLSDGIGSLDVSTISPDHGVAINAIFVDRIEILRGPATLLYGSSASGGLINVISNQILDYVPEGLEGDLYSHFDSASHDLTGGLRFNVGYDEFTFHLDTTHRKTQDIDIPGFALSVPEEGDIRGTLQNSNIESHDTTFGSSWVHDRGFIGFSINNFDNNYGIPGHEEEDEEEDGEHEEESVRIKQEQTRFDIKSELEDPFPGFTLIKSRWGYNDHTHEELEGDEIGTQLDNKELQGRVELLHQSLAGWEGVLGFQHQNRKLSTSGEEAFLPNSSLNSVGIFVLERAEFEQLHIEVGGRYEHQTTDSESVSSVSHDLFSFSAGLGFHWTESLNTRLSFTRSQRAPAIEELFSNGAHLATNTFEIGNLDLKEETTHSLDLIFNKTDGRLTGEANLFVSKIDDYIYTSENDRNSDGISDRVEDDFLETAQIVTDEEALLLVNHIQSDALFYGIELQTRLNIFDHIDESLDLKMWADYVRGKLEDNQNLPRITPWRVGLGLDYHRGPFELYFDANHTARQTKLAQLETSTDSYTDITLGLSYEVINKELLNFNLFMRGTNLLDEEIRQHTSFVKDIAPQQGRSLIVGFKLQF